MKVTMDDVARMAGVSKATVSRVVNNIHEGVGQATRMRVLKIIQETNYRTCAAPNQTQQSKTLGLIIPDIINPFFGELAKAAESYATEQGYTVLFGNTDFSVERELKYISIFSAKKVDGIILVTTAQTANDSYRRLKKYNIPLVLVDRMLSGIDYAAGIFLDNSYALFMACSLLIKHENRGIVFLSGPKDFSTSAERVRGYQDALSHHGIPFEARLVKYGDYTFDSGYRSIMELAREGIPFTGILASNDTMALGAMQALKELSFKIPEDVEVIGFDNIGFSQLCDPPLTTIQQPTIGLAFLTLLGVTVIVFALLQMMPGEPINSIVPLDAPESLRQVMIERYGFDKPIYVQYFLWLGNALRGDFGNSISDNRVVLTIVGESLRNTLVLALGASIVAFALSILIGIYSAYRPKSVFSWLGTVFGVGGISIPNYCLSLILIGIFSVTLHIFPSTGMYTSGDYTFASLMKHLVLPAFAAGAMTLGIMTRMVRSSVAEVCNRSFVTTLRAKGLSESAIMRHVLRNSFPTLLTVGGLQFGYLMGGSTMVETIFSWPGIGLTIYQSIFTSDFPTTQAAILIVAAIFVSINLMIDLLRIVADPRLRT